MAATTHEDLAAALRGEGDGAALERLLAAPHEVDAEALARAVHAVPDDALRRHASPEVRRAVTAEVLRRLPEYLHAERVAGVDEAVAFDLGDGARHLVRVQDGTVHAGPDDGSATPRVTLTVDEVGFLRIVTGGGDPAAQWLRGDLRLAGDERFALELASWFRVPGATDGAIDPFAVDVGRIARVIKEVPDKELRERLRGGLREVVLEQVFTRVPTHVRADRIDGVRGAMRFTLTGRADGEADRWAIVFGDGDVRAERDSEAEGRVTLKMDAADFLKLVTNNLNPTVAFVRGRLKLKGDVAFAASFLRLFDLPKPA